MAGIKELSNKKFRIDAYNGRLPNGKLNRKTWVIDAKSLKDAERQAVILENEFKHGKQSTIKNATFNDLVNEWRNSDKLQQLSPKTIERYEGMLEGQIIPCFGVWKLDSIRPLDVSHFISSLRQSGIRKDKNNLNPYSDKTIQGYYILLHTLFDKAVKWELMSENICDKVDKPTIKKHFAEFYDTVQIDTLLDELEKEGDDLNFSLTKRNPNHRNKTEQRKSELIMQRKYMYALHRCYVYLSLASACRRSEICGLQWDDINLDTTSMKVQRTCQYTKSEGVFLTDYLKNGSASKTMYLPKTVIDILREYKEVQLQYKEIMGNKWLESGMIFTGIDGNTIHPNNISLWFKRFLHKHELPYITLHEVRHSSISFMLMNDVPITVVAERAGHKDATVTVGIYGHVFDGNKKQAVETMDKMFNR